MLRSIKCDCHCDQESNMVMVMVMVHIEIVGRGKGGGEIPPLWDVGVGGIPSPGDEIPPT